MLKTFGRIFGECSIIPGGVIIFVSLVYLYIYIEWLQLHTSNKTTVASKIQEETSVGRGSQASDRPAAGVQDLRRSRRGAAGSQEVAN